MRININDAELFVHVQGDLESDALPVIAHHGAPGFSSHEEPSAAFRALADTHPIISYDARGSGVSEYKGPYTHEQWAADLEGIRQHFGIEKDRKSTRLNSSHVAIAYADCCVKKERVEAA